jgi:hypothetical protein
VNFFQEVWAGYRPYLVKFVIDILISASLWVGLFIFKVLTYYLPVSGWAGDFIVHYLHPAGIVAAYGIFAWLFVVDIIQMKSGGIECFA